MSSPIAFCKFVLVSLLFAHLGVANGFELHMPVVGEVQVDSDAHKLGFRAGDRIVSLNSKTINSWEELVVGLRGLRGQRVSVGLQRLGGQRLDLMFTPEGRDGIARGMSNQLTPPIVALSPNSALLRYGIEVGDILSSIEGRPVLGWNDISPLLSSADSKRPLNIEVLSRKRLYERISLGVAQLSDTYSIKALGLQNPKLFVASVRRKSLAEQVGIKSDDRIFVVQGRPLDEKFDLKNWQTAVRRESKMNIEVIRGNEVKHLELAKPSLGLDRDGGIDEFYKVIGVEPLGKSVPAPAIAGAHPILWLKYKLGGIF